MYYVNKIVMGLANPVTVGLVMLLVALVCGMMRRRRVALGVGTVGFLWMLVWTHPLLLPDWDRQLEAEYPPVSAESMPKADVIVILGGGMSKGKDTPNIYPEMHPAADRVWHAARLYKAGKAPLVFASGRGEERSSAVLLKDLGVPESAIVIEPNSRNTEENAAFVVKMLEGKQEQKILLVTSAWHMRRALLMFERAIKKAAPKHPITVIPAAADYEALNISDRFDLQRLFPSATCMSIREIIFKEILGYYGYKFFRPN